MKITIDNLGVVRHIEFDTQKPLSLFCGPNSTGKTYVAYVLYAVMRYADSFLFDNSGNVEKDNKMIKVNHFERNIGDILGVSDEYVESQFKRLKIGVSILLGDNILHNTIMLSVERNSIYTFKTELSLSRNDLVDRMMALKDKSDVKLSEILTSSSRRYPMAIKNDLKIANDLEFFKKYKGEFFDFATNLEQSLLRGRVDVAQNGDVEFIVGENVHLPIQVSSSIVKTLSSLILYLKYIVKKGDTIIIDEPEMNLHPDNQILLARIFAQMVNMGIKLVISTHSDYIIRELNNLIMLSGVPDNDVQSFSKMGYDKSMMLKKEDVAAYMFNFDKENLVTVGNLDVTETGFDVPTIDAAINSINEASEELYYSLKSRQNEKEHRND